MNEQFTALKEQIDSLDPMLKYSFLVMLARFVHEELPNAYEEFEATRNEMITKFLSLFKEDDECD